MRFQSTFRLPETMRLKPKAAPVAPKPKVPKPPKPSKPKVKASLPMDRVLEACAELASLAGGVQAVRQRTTEAVRDIFQALVSGIMVRDAEGYHATAVFSG